MTCFTFVVRALKNYIQISTNKQISRNKRSHNVNLHKTNEIINSKICIHVPKSESFHMLTRTKVYMKNLKHTSWNCFYPFFYKQCMIINAMFPIIHKCHGKPFFSSNRQTISFFQNSNIHWGTSFCNVFFFQWKQEISMGIKIIDARRFIRPKWSHISM